MERYELIFRRVLNALVYGIAKTPPVNSEDRAFMLYCECLKRKNDFLKQFKDLIEAKSWNVEEYERDLNEFADGLFSKDVPDTVTVQREQKKDYLLYLVFMLLTSSLVILKKLKGPLTKQQVERMVNISVDITVSRLNQVEEICKLMPVPLLLHTGENKDDQTETNENVILEGNKDDQREKKENGILKDNKDHQTEIVQNGIMSNTCYIPVPSYVKLLLDFYVTIAHLGGFIFMCMFMGFLFFPLNK